MPVHYDESRSPLLVCADRGKTTDAEFESRLALMGATLSRQQRFGILLDTRGADRMTPKHRHMQAQWNAANAAALKQYCLGMSFIIDSAIIRGVLTAILWVQPLPMPHSVFATYDPAEAWIIERLTAAGLRVPGRKVVG